jgi:hypothetical protein
MKERTDAQRKRAISKLTANQLDYVRVLRRKMPLRQALDRVIDTAEKKRKKL